MLSVIVGENSVGKSLLLKRLKEIILNPKFLISEFPNELSMEDLKEEKSAHFEIFLSGKNIERYRECLLKSISSSLEARSPQLASTMSNFNYELLNEMKKGFTNELNIKDYLENKDEASKFTKEMHECILKTDLNPKELGMLVKKYSRVFEGKENVNDDDLNVFISRQLEKKLCFSNMLELLKHDCFYKSEVDSVNTFLKEKKFPYYIELKDDCQVEKLSERDIYLVHRRKSFKLPLSEIGASERTMLHFYLIVREESLIKIHEKIDLNQILLFDQIDMHLDVKRSNELIEFVRFYFVKNMNIQCILTTNNHLTIAKCTRDCLFRMSYNEASSEITLDKLSIQNSVDQDESLKSWSTSQSKMKIPYLNKALEYHWDQKSRVELSMKLRSLTNENNALKSTVDELKNEILNKEKVLKNKLEENQSLKKELDEFKEKTYFAAKKQIAESSQKPSTESIVNEKETKSNHLEWKQKLADTLKKNTVEISEQESREFIVNLKQEADNFEGRSRDMISKSIELLGPNLYTSELSFLNELIQNFDDAEYRDLEKCLKIVLCDAFILFASNQIALKPNEVKGICSIGESTKKKGIYLFKKKFCSV